MTALIQSTTSYELHVKFCQLTGISPMAEISYNVVKPRLRASHALYWVARTKGLDNVSAEQAIAEQLAKLDYFSDL